MQKEGAMSTSTLNSPTVANVLDRLYANAELSDKPLRDEMQALTPQKREERMKQMQANYRATYEALRDAYIPITRDFGCLLYILACGCRATTIVEFGTSFGLSTIPMAAALRDNGGGSLITTEFLPDKAERARRNLEAAGLADLVELRVGDALETLKGGVGRPIDLVLLDGAKDLYLPVLKLLEPSFRRGTLVATDNTSADSPYAAHIRDPGSGYASVGLPGDNEVSLRI
jgi:predicted O-methyltransferase YrrM